VGYIIRRRIKDSSNYSGMNGQRVNYLLNLRESLSLVHKGTQLQVHRKPEIGKIKRSIIQGVEISKGNWTDKKQGCSDSFSESTAI